MTSLVACEVFKDGACHIRYLQDQSEHDPKKIRAVRSALRLFIDNKEELRKSQAYIDAALHHIYPGLGKTDLAELEKLLEEELEIVKKILRHREVADSEFEQVINFCMKMWIQLRYQEMGLPPHMGSELSIDETK